MPTLVNSLEEMNARMAQWNSERQLFDRGNELMVRQNDVVIFQFVASGNDGNSFIMPYKAHEFDRISAKGTRYSEHRYCPIQSGDETFQECVYCQQGHPTIKARMSIWMFVHSILHAALPDPQKPLPQFQYGSGVYFKEDIANFKVWHTSAWSESPWTDIKKLGEMYSGLHNFTAQMDVVGAGIGRRFKIYAIPNSAMLAPETYAAAQAQCEPIINILKSKLATPVVWNPQQQQQPIQQTAPTYWQPPAPQAPVGAYTPPGVASSMPVFTPGAAMPTPAAPVAPPAETTPAPPPPPPVAEQTRQEEPQPMANTPPPPPAPPQAPVQQTTQQEDNRRPLQKMF